MATIAPCLGIIRYAILPRVILQTTEMELAIRVSSKQRANSTSVPAESARKRPVTDLVHPAHVLGLC